MRYADGAYNQASGTRDSFGLLSAQLVREGHPDMVSISGDREPADQLRIWHQRMTLNPGGRKVYGWMWWNGQKWYRIHPDLVGAPGTSDHERRRSNDLAWPYNSNTAAHRRAQQLAPQFGIVCDGKGFSSPEWWHWTNKGNLGTIGTPAAPAGGSGSAPIETPTLSEEDDMAVLVTGGGQNLILGGKLIGLNGTDVGLLSGGGPRGAQVIEVTPGTHYNIIQEFAKDNHAQGLPVIVYVRDGNGTVYLLTDGKLEALVDPTTLAELHSKGAYSLTFSQAEVNNLLSAD